MPGEINAHPSCYFRRKSNNHPVNLNGSLTFQAIRLRKFLIF